MDKPPPYATAVHQPSAPLGATTYTTYGTTQAPPSGYHGYQPGGPGLAPVTNVTIIQPDIIVIGGCPACSIGVLEEEYSCLGLLCAIAFFPIGVLCCLAMKSRRCSNCGAVFD